MTKAVKCYLCHGKAARSDQCYGCQEYFHIDCEHWPPPNGIHIPEDHRPKTGAVRFPTLEKKPRWPAAAKRVKKKRGRKRKEADNGT